MPACAEKRPSPWTKGLGGGMTDQGQFLLRRSREGGNLSGTSWANRRA